MKLPLKFGLILASYPDILPISLSKKSDGDIGMLRDLALSVSFVATKLRTGGGGKKTKQQKQNILLDILLGKLILQNLSLYSFVYEQENSEVDTAFHDSLSFKK